MDILGAGSGLLRRLRLLELLVLLLPVMSPWRTLYVARPSSSGNSVSRRTCGDWGAGASTSGGTCGREVSSPSKNLVTAICVEGGS